MPNKTPTSFKVAVVTVVVATVLRGVLGLGALGASVTICALFMLVLVTALGKSATYMKRVAIGLGVYGLGFVIQSLLLSSYVGSRQIDLIWGAILVAAAGFLHQSKQLEQFYGPASEPEAGQ